MENCSLDHIYLGKLIFIPVRRQLPTLKAFYYLDHFEEMVAFIREHNHHLIGGNEEAFLTKFESLSKLAKGLLIRLSNRKARIFSKKSISYDELGPPQPILDELLGFEFISQPEPGNFKQLVTALTKSGLLELLEVAGIGLRGVRSLNKSRLIKLVEQHCSFQLLERFGYSSNFIILGKVEVIEYLRFIFFGKSSGNMQAFALRDLGITKTRGNHSRFESRFANMRDAKAAFFYSKMDQRIKECSLDGLVLLVDEATTWPAIGRDEMISLLGSELERHKSVEHALKAYELSNAHPARERRCRILYSKGERHEVRLMLKEMISSPNTDEELLFAEDFYARKYSKRTVGVLTSTLRNSRVFKINEAYRGSAEQGVINYLKQTGATAIHSENNFWATLFGCYFWDELFQKSVNEFDRQPAGLYSGRLGEDYPKTIAAKLEKFQPRYIHDCLERHLDEANGLFTWRPDTVGVLLEFIKHCTPSLILRAFKRIIDDPTQNLCGYPDLLIIDGIQISFLEVKAEGDQLRRNQLAQIMGLKECGFEVDIARVEWESRPDQEYVVVDVETTGCSPIHHRITEIGAVKMVGCEIVDRFQSLVNPLRPIPKNIQNLTGITNEMVAGAPAFSSLADEIRNFIGGSIFVAHNAKFDFGFIRQEFERIGQEFRSPKICTVVESRKRLPNARSYSLANLCRDFAIPLHRHHRALDDAKATAELFSILLKTEKL